MQRNRCLESSSITSQAPDIRNCQRSREGQRVQRRPSALVAYLVAVFKSRIDRVVNSRSHCPDQSVIAAGFFRRNQTHIAGDLLGRPWWMVFTLPSAYFDSQGPYFDTSVHS